MKQFSIRFAIFSAVIACGLAAWDHFTPEKFHVVNGWLSFSILCVVTYFMHLLLARAGEKQPGHFVRTFMGTTTLKLFLFLVIILLYCVLERETAMKFSLGFLAQYFLFTSFEVWALLKHFNK